VGYEKARLVAAHADDTTVDAWIERAQGMTCMNLKFELEARERAQMCARGELDLRVPRGVGALLDAAVRAAREDAGYWLSPGECLTRIAEHFVETWEEALAERSNASEEGPGTRRRLLPGAGLQPGGGARPPRDLPLEGRG
jgi:hypothetical protein